jgi:hypothetical protein
MVKLKLHGRISGEGLQLYRCKPVVVSSTLTTSVPFLPLVVCELSTD